MHASSDAVHVEAENWALDRLGDEAYDPGQPNDYEALYAARSQRIVELEKLRRVEADLRTFQHRREQFERKSREQALASLAHPENIKTVGLLSSSSNASQGPPAAEAEAATCLDEIHPGRGVKKYISSIADQGSANPSSSITSKQ
eukprot:CAMPEP_0171561034 /NCGR_PEP_ID=MMETSP0960-20121227/14057_1 /TAXON_ID=87120 /ORGANISM="Aurantiochytrium limacinum, Strain ATCCMYA-1381" /LENGTH=144 /DNA_ID=CAMNT_0012113359 /DNA_START=209 /DNA_END=644 /DNA_ORIENTATION=+